MRIIAGKAKGRRLKTPAGHRTRPTSDLVRGAIFSMLESQGVVHGRILDLYAGSGSLGIEALSRGAEVAHFVDKDRECCAIIKGNLQETGLSAQGAVFCIDATRSLKDLEPPYDLILLDPPYGIPDLPQFVDQLANSRLPSSEATIVVEHSKRQALAPSYGAFHLARTLQHGDTLVSVYRGDALDREKEAA